MRFPTLLLALASLTLAACDASEPGPDLADGPALPVAQGNTWTYSDGLTLTVGAPAEVDGESYFELEISQNGRVSDDNEYVRAVGQGVELLYTAPPSYREATVYRYPVEAGYREGGRSYGVERERVTVPAGTFEVVTYSGYDGDPSVSASLAPGVGIVRFFDGQTARELTDYDLR